MANTAGRQTASFKGRNIEKAMKVWTQAIADQLKEDIKSLRPRPDIAGEDPNLLSHDATAARIISKLRPQQIAFLTVVEALRMTGPAGDDGVKFALLMVNISEAIELEFKAKIVGGWKGNAAVARFINRNKIDRWNKPLSNEQVQAEYNVETAQPSRYVAKSALSHLEIVWTTELKCSIGAMMIGYLLKYAKHLVTAEVDGETIEEEHPAFQQSFPYVAGTKVGVIKLHRAIVELFTKNSVASTLQHRHLPMLCTPRPWTSFDEGAYLTTSTQPVRTSTHEQRKSVKEDIKDGRFDRAFRALDYLGSVPWVVNKKVLAVITQVWNTGDQFLSIPTAKPEVDIPDAPKTDILPEGQEQDSKEIEMQEHRIWVKKQKKVISARRGAHSERCNISYKLTIAHAFQNEVMYFPHNIDFRGRAYPVPPNLSHIGDDLSRSLLKFAEGKPLGKEGLRWLKVHLSNTYGKSKLSFDDREQFAMDHLDDIFKSADAPLEHDWWQKADDPWQCLATCFELTGALRYKNPIDFVSHLPVHQDGTCNGLQHYAALGGDVAGAAHVNLSNNPAGKPADVYSGVADLVNQKIDQHCKSGLPEALVLKGHVTRKVIKQTVMTTVYGVTFFGAKQQIEKQLKDIPEIPAEKVSACALYLSRQVLLSIGDLFKGASRIQQWLLHLAYLVVNSRNLHTQQQNALTQRENKSKSVNLQKARDGIGMTSMKWYSPIGVGVIQPYRKDVEESYSTVIQKVALADSFQSMPVDPAPQCAALAPNFIHSLDASHMMMTALKMEESSLTFAMVHDSFWTHAADIPQMAKHLREAFVELHSLPILENFCDDVCPLVSHVQQSTHFFLADPFNGWRAQIFDTEKEG
ncbi:DNA/RNA polymerase [Atractiella rhizophila]|nr:DNA/RNA polymerase [Atractiella rhizophila]